MYVCACMCVGGGGGGGGEGGGVMAGWTEEDMELDIILDEHLI